jgi:hypothetical protein
MAGDLVLDKDDVKQEIAEKLIKTIRTYLSNHKEYIEGRRVKQMDIELYVKMALGNRVTDFIRKIAKQKNTVSFTDTLAVEVGVEDSTVDIKNGVYAVNGIDFLEGLSGVSREIYKAFLDGETIGSIGHLNDGVVSLNQIRNIIKVQKDKFEGMREQLFEGRERYMSVSLQEDGD